MNKKIFLLLLFSVLLVGIVSAVTTRDLLSYYSFDGIGGISQEDDIYNHLRNGTQTSTTNTTGKLKFALDYSGSTQYVTYGSYPQLTFPFSLSFWINPDTTGNFYPVSRSTNFENQLNAGLLAFATGGGTVTYPIASSDWTHVVEIYNGTHILLYVNNSLNVSEAGTPIGNSGNDLKLGVRASGIGGTDYFDGQIDELGVWNRSLNSTDVEDLYNSGNGLDFSNFVIVEQHVISLQFPESDSQIITEEENFTVNLSFDYNPKSYEWINNTIVIWYSNGTLFNETITTGLSGDSTQVIEKIENLQQYNHYWNSYACYGNVSFSVCYWNDVGNFSFIVSPVIESFLSSNVYETSLEYYGVNVSNTFGTISNVYLNYDGTIGGMTSQGNGIYNISKSLLSSNIGNNTINYIHTISGVNYTSKDYYQQVNPILFGLCNATLTVQYINFSFKDEETLLDLNATMDTSTWVYYLGDGTDTKTLIFSNTSLNDNYAFCLSPGNRTLHNTRNIQYASTGYPQRKYDASSDLTNVTTNKTLYLLSSTDGIYSTIQVVDQDGDKVSGAEVTVERQFSGIWTIIGQETTDDAGLVTFWLNPDYDHRFTFVDDDCTGLTVTIRPTQTQYTQQLQCGVSDAIYVSQIEGIKYARRPGTGIIQPGTYNFSFQIVSSKENLVNVSMQLVNSSNGVVLNSTYSSCTPGGCTIYVMHVITGGDDIKGKYYIDIGNGTILLEGDARWRVIDIPTVGKVGIKTFFNDIRYVIDEWGDDTDTADFNRLVIVFFFMALTISALNYQFGNDTQNPGAFLVIMTIVILFGSLSGSFVGGEMTGQGFFYYNNLSGNNFINNYILAFFTMIITVAYFINVNRRAQQ